MKKFFATSTRYKKQIPNTILVFILLSFSAVVLDFYSQLNLYSTFFVFFVFFEFFIICSYFLKPVFKIDNYTLEYYFFKKCYSTDLHSVKSIVIFKNYDFYELHISNHQACKLIDRLDFDDVSVLKNKIKDIPEIYLIELEAKRHSILPIFVYVALLYIIFSFFPDFRYFLFSLAKTTFLFFERF